MIREKCNKARITILRKYTFRNKIVGYCIRDENGKIGDIGVNRLLSMIYATINTFGCDCVRNAKIIRNDKGMITDIQDATDEWGRSSVAKAELAWSVYPEIVLEFIYGVVKSELLREYVFKKYRKGLKEIKFDRCNDTFTIDGKELSIKDILKEIGA